MADKMLVIGAGYLGERFARHFGERAELVRVDVTDLAVLSGLLEEKRPAVVINAAAKTLTGELEKPEHQARGYDVNVRGVANLHLLAQRYGFRLVQLSTVMFFDGERPGGGGWQESDLPEPVNYYSWTKAWADAQLAPFGERDGILIARLHMPLSAESHSRNLLNKLLRFDKAVDIPQSLTVVEDLLAGVEKLLERQATGIYHLVNPGTISLYEVGCLLDEAGLRERPTPMTRDGLNALGGARQTFPIVDTSKLAAAGVVLPPVREAVSRAVSRFAAEYKKAPEGQGR